MPGLDTDYGGKGGLFVLFCFVLFSFGLGLGSIVAFSQLTLAFR